MDDGKSRHDAVVESEDGTTSTRRNYRFNLAAYELDNTLELYLVPPTVERVIDGRAASLTWWVDEVAMGEADRRAKKIQPPDAERWNAQIEAVRVYDELLANAYRNIGPELESEAVGGPRPSHAWTELLITRDWNIWLIDHTATFRTLTQLEHPESLTRCDRSLLSKLRALDMRTFQQRLGKYLSPQQLTALEIRRVLLVKHFDEQIARNGERLVLYDLPRRLI